MSDTRPYIPSWDKKGIDRKSLEEVFPIKHIFKRKRKESRIKAKIRKKSQRKNRK